MMICIYLIFSKGERTNRSPYDCSPPKKKQVIEDATTIFLDTNPISRPLKKHADAMKNLKNVERLQYCKSVLRPFVEDTLGFNVVDSAIAVVMTMDRGGFDPDMTGAYGESGCAISSLATSSLSPQYSPRFSAICRFS